MAIAPAPLSPTRKARAWCLAGLLIAALVLAGCGAHIHHRVEPGETLYSVSWIYGYDYRDVARWNRIKPPYKIVPNQFLRVAPPAGDVPVARAAAPASQARPAAPAPIRPASDEDGGDPPPITWSWPAQGRVIKPFSHGNMRQDGIDIAGKIGQPIYASAGGKIVYRGSGLLGYGMLIIIKHSQAYLSAYAHNSEIVVKEGDSVRAGQLIARMGDTGTDRTKLHFQIRYNGKPVDPLNHLPKREP